MVTKNLLHRLEHRRIFCYKRKIVFSFVLKKFHSLIIHCGKNSCKYQLLFFSIGDSEYFTTRLTRIKSSCNPCEYLLIFLQIRVIILLFAENSLHKLEYQRTFYTYITSICTKENSYYSSRDKKFITWRELSIPREPEYAIDPF